jgi:hypothetical protein
VARSIENAAHEGGTIVKNYSCMRILVIGTIAIGYLPSKVCAGKAHVSQGST